MVLKWLPRFEITVPVGTVLNTIDWLVATSLWDNRTGWQGVKHYWLTSGYHARCWRYTISAGTGWPAVSILWVAEVDCMTCYFCLSVAARTLVQAKLSLRNALRIAWTWSDVVTNSVSVTMSYCLDVKWCGYSVNATMLYCLDVKWCGYKQCERYWTWSDLVTVWALPCCIAWTRSDVVTNTVWAILDVKWSGYKQCERYRVVLPGREMIWVQTVWALSCRKGLTLNCPSLTADLHIGHCVTVRNFRSLFV